MKERAPMMWRVSDVVLRSFQTTRQKDANTFLTSSAKQRRYFLTKCDFSVYGTIVD